MYTIQLLSGDSSRLEVLRDALLARIAKDGRFRVGEVIVSNTNVGRREAKEAGLARDLRWMRPTLYLRRIRLVKAKPYCGQHYGECPADARRPNATYLEYEDWVEFHRLVNGLFNQRKVNANIWTLPLEVKGKYWVRKGLNARKLYEAELSYDNYGRRIQQWNLGDATQF